MSVLHTRADSTDAESNEQYSPEEFDDLQRALYGAHSKHEVRELLNDALITLSTIAGANAIAAEPAEPSLDAHLAARRLRSIRNALRNGATA